MARRSAGVRMLVVACLAAFALGAGASPTGRASAVLSLRLTGVVDPFMASYVERAIAAAAADGDPAVLLVIDTPGGLDSSMRRIVQAILGARVPVICYTAPSGSRAASAGTFIMLACPVNAMAPGTNIGAAHPVGVSGAIEQKKVTNDAAAFIRSLAERTHRNADWAEKAVRDAVSADAEHAHDIRVIDFLAPSVGFLLRAVGRCSPGSTSLPHSGAAGDPRYVVHVCSAPVAPFRMSIEESLFHGFANPDVAFLLLNIGFIALIAWVFHPGLHVSLALGVVCTVLGLLILETLPVQLVGIALLLVAAVLFVLDVKATAHGVLTAGGIALLVLAGLLLFNPSVPNARVSRPLLVVVAIAVGLSATALLRALLAARKLPPQSGIERLLGATGIAATALDPVGSVRARGEWWTAESVAGPIEAGSPVRIVRLKGLKLQVEPDTPHATGLDGIPEGGEGP